MVWRVSGGKSTLFLAGSFHLLQASDYPLPEPYEIAWRECSHVVMEIPPGEAERPEIAAGMKSLIRLKSGTLAERIAPATWQDLITWAGQTSYSVAALETQPPWMAGLTVAVTTSARLGFKPEHGIERHFTARLTGSGKTTEGLETTLGQLSLFDRVPALQQEAMLRQALTEASTMGETAASLTQAWRSGDTDALHATINASFRDFPELKKLLLDDRHAAWLPRLEVLLQGDRPVMVLVGAGHLCGPGNVVELLREKGYQCEPLKVSAITPAQVPAPTPVKKAA